MTSTLTTIVSLLLQAHSARHRHRKLRIQIAKFDQLIDWQSFPGKVTLKLDIEGSEYAFLKGAEEMITNLKPNLLMEINPQSLRASGISGDVLLGILKDLGYQYFAELIEPEVRLGISELSATKFRNILLYMS